MPSKYGLNIPLESTNFPPPSSRIPNLEKTLSKALRAICLTRDYVGESVLPPLEGWEWYDAGKMISELIPDDEWSEQFRLRTTDK